MEAGDRTVLYYQTVSNVSPFRDWRARIAAQDAKARIDARIARFRGGNFGDSKSVGSGVIESRLDFGPGYRIYYGIAGSDVIVLLCGGDKSTQDSDIALAKVYWADYKRRANPGPKVTKRKAGR
jgi:putative addiction module killer protein